MYDQYSSLGLYVVKQYCTVWAKTNNIFSGEIPPEKKPTHTVWVNKNNYNNSSNRLYVVPLIVKFLKHFMKLNNYGGLNSRMFSFNGFHGMEWGVPCCIFRWGPRASSVLGISSSSSFFHRVLLNHSQSSPSPETTLPLKILPGAPGS